MKRKLNRMLMASALTLALLFSTSLVYAYTVNVVPTSQSPYDVFKSYFGSNPVDGPSSGYITNATSSGVGNVFQFYAPATGMYDGSNTDRQRNEVKVYNSSPSNLKGTYGTYFSYNWKFKPMSNFQMSPSGAFNHVWQLKASGGDDGAPILTFSVHDNKLNFRHSPIGANMDQVQVLASTNWSNVSNQWVEADVLVQNTDNGLIEMTLKKLDGTVLMSYSGYKDNWRSNADFNRPKWGIYRKIFPGMTEAHLQFSNFKITNHGTTKPSSGGSYEAEKATLNGAAATGSCSGCSGASKVRFVGNGSANWVQFNVNASSSGTYTMDIDYLVDGTRSFYVSVNGGSGTQYSVSGSSWNNPARRTVNVSLNAGNNTIRFYNNSANAPDFDRIVIR